MIQSSHSEGGQRRYAHEVLWRVSFIRIAQQLDVSLEEIRASLASLPDASTPTKADWQRLARSWRKRGESMIESPRSGNCATTSATASDAAVCR